jgi:hypothetical protein
VSRLLGSVAHRLDPDRYDLTGTWQALSEEPDSPNTSIRVPVEERIEITQVGNSIDCKSAVTGSDPREFRYRLKVSHSMVYGTYEKKVDRPGVQLGSGMIQMIIDPNRKKMAGSVTWYDSDTGQIEHSKAEWKLL